MTAVRTAGRGVGRPPKTVRITTHVSVGVGRYLQTRAAEAGLSLSAVTAALLEEAVRLPLDHEHGSLVEAAVARAIRRELDRLGDLVVRAVLDSDETRRLVLTLLVKEIGPDQTRMFRREAHSASWQRLKEPLAVPPEHHGTWPATPARS